MCYKSRVKINTSKNLCTESFINKDDYFGFTPLDFSDSYNITNAKGKVARFQMFKQAYKLGEDIVGIFDFTEGTVPCVQVSMVLECFSNRSFVF